ncbi:hypothetical protein LF887_00545 [Chryseobacterium sp. MEBOG06]|uniref:hypothetical protein n=1 Tax=Chryseobacterium sp. MEBOG06 TaxID=2879938 RepID=UPI001F471299|nr:hypothetical protein [Chryseobacterium sp. MEBOG06]UKB84171.1 hypothetical protein LF887_00545 [Chryseobacterium sp. MEBOG06]
MKNYYNQHRSMLNKEFKKKFDEESNTLKKSAIKGDFLFFMKKMDSIENNALIGALVKVRNLEDLRSINSLKAISSEKLPDIEKVADYPGGLNSLRQEVANLLYVDGVYSQEKTIKTDVAFMVEKDGSVSNVHAQGDNFTFNRQAEIALYSLAEKFSPAVIKGDPAIYRFTLPLTLTITD